MNSKTLSTVALKVIDEYLHFRLGRAVCSVPYFNNKTTRHRLSMRVFVGKGTANDIRDEAQSLLLKDHVDPNQLTDESLKKLLANNNLGIDCSALAYYVLDAELQIQHKVKLKSKIVFNKGNGFIWNWRRRLRPAENCDVATLAAEENSKVVTLGEVQPGDFIAMIGDNQESERNHILLIHQVDYENGQPGTIYYTHAAADPEDGVYGTGLKQGQIDIPAGTTSLLQALWSENGSTEKAARIRDRARKSQTTLRRLAFF